MQNFILNISQKTLGKFRAKFTDDDDDNDDDGNNNNNNNNKLSPFSFLGHNFPLTLGCQDCCPLYIKCGCYLQFFS
jgi:hypothetical protein